MIQGIPENIQQEQRQRQAAAAAPAPAAVPGAEGGDDDDNVNLFDLAAQRGGSGGRGAAAGAGAGAGADLGAAAGGDMGNLDFLRSHPQFQQLRQVVQAQPQMLEPILQQIAAGNPQLAERIASNPDQFAQLLSEEGDDDAPLPPGAQSVAVTPEERDAIERVRLWEFACDFEDLDVLTATPVDPPRLQL